MTEQPSLRRRFLTLAIGIAVGTLILAGWKLPVSPCPALAKAETEVEKRQRASPDPLNAWSASQQVQKLHKGNFCRLCGGTGRISLFTKWFGKVDDSAPGGQGTVD